MKLKKVVIIGMGLIGGSIGKALLKQKMAGEVVGVCRRESSLRRAVKRRSLTRGFVNEYEKAARGADLIIIATPVYKIKEILRAIAGSVGRGTLVMDVGSTKKEIVALAGKYRNKFSFVGAHPLAGSEKSGVEFSEPGLFKGSLCVLTRTGSTKDKDLRFAISFWRALGARTEVVSPEKHDEILAFTSHLPHVLAYSLAGSQKKEYKKFAATGFKDTSRIASSDPSLWRDIFLTNRVEVLKSIACFKKVLSGIENDIRKKNAEALLKKLEGYKKTRDEILQG